MLDALRPVTANLVRQMKACFSHGNEGDMAHIRVLLALDEDGAVGDVGPHLEMPVATSRSSVRQCRR
ncbi:MAG: hypothetical protein JWR39_2253 [Devosia sp.]|jgi:hypothetical protein|nr:hypothetical protein [Devosia sp.]